MRHKTRFAACIFFLGVEALCAQQRAAGANRLRAGVELYGRGLWDEAAGELRRCQSETADAGVRAEAQFWIGMSEIAAGHYREALLGFDEIPRLDPSSPRRQDALYQKGRVLYQLGNYNEAIILFKNYADNIHVDGGSARGGRAEERNSRIASSDGYNRKAAAIFWMGECLYALDEFDRAASMYKTIIEQYSSSVKNEAALQRLAMIQQKMTEEGLLEVIKLSASEEPDAAYNDALLAYKNSIAPFLVPSENGAARPRTNSGQNPETMMRLLQIKTQALEMLDKLTSTLNAFESLEWEAREPW